MAAPKLIFFASKKTGGDKKNKQEKKTQDKSRQKKYKHQFHGESNRQKNFRLGR